MSEVAGAWRTVDAGGETRRKGRVRGGKYLLETTRMGENDTHGGNGTHEQREYMKTASVHPSPETVRVHTKKNPREKEEER